MKAVFRCKVGYCLHGEYESMILGDGCLVGGMMLIGILGMNCDHAFVKAEVEVEVEMK